MLEKPVPAITDPYESFYLILKEFADIPLDEFRKISHLFHLKRLKKNSHFKREGDKPDTFAFVVTGLFRSYYMNDQGEEYIKNFVRPNEMIAAYSSFLTGTDSIINIEALQDAVILECNFEDFFKIGTGIHWERFRRKLAELLFVQRETREYELLTLDATDRYKKFLSKFAAIENELNDYHIASYLGITAVSFSRIKKKLKLD